MFHKRLWEAINCLRMDVVEISENRVGPLVSCDKCKCVIKECDAIKGKSRVVNPKPKPFNILDDSLGQVSTYTMTTTTDPYYPPEEIEKVYYCHRCKKA